VGWAVVVGCMKRPFQAASLLEVDSKPDFFIKKNIIQVVMFQNALMDPKISKEKKIFLFFPMSF
jgi:hypothetical protein